MVLIFGGAYQGKLAYALERFGLLDDDVYRCDAGDTAAPGNKSLVYELDKWILALVREGADVAEAVKLFIAENDQAIVICNDISCGVVPEDPVLRKWREEVGRAMVELASASGEVVRVFCGIASVLKDHTKK